MEKRYLDFMIKYNPKPIPDRSFDWDYWHVDYDGPDDIRQGCAGSLESAMDEINDLIQIIEDEYER